MTFGVCRLMHSACQYCTGGECVDPLLGAFTAVTTCLSVTILACQPLVFLLLAQVKHVYTACEQHHLMLYLMLQERKANKHCSCLAHAIHQAVQYDVEVNTLSAFHELCDHTPHFMPAEAHIHDVIYDLIQWHTLRLCLIGPLHQSPNTVSLCTDTCNRSSILYLKSLRPTCTRLICRATPLIGQPKRCL